MDKRMYEWAKGSTSDETIKKALEKRLDIISTIRSEMESDDDNESVRLLGLYEAADDNERAILDAALVALCGWTMENIIETTDGKVGEDDD